MGIVLVFHDVEKNSHSLKQFSVYESSFKKFVEKLIDTGFDFLSIDSIETGEIFSKKNWISITFDDGYLGVLNYAIPYLRSKEIPYTLFLTEGFLGKAGFLNYQDVKRLINDSLCTIGFHSKNHKIFSHLKETEILTEIDKTDFEKDLGIVVKYFAFPYGSIYTVSKTAITLVKSSGYSLAFSTLSYPVKKDDITKRKFFLPRITVTEKAIENVYRYLLRISKGINAH